MLSWFLLRHIAYMAVCWSVFVDLPREIKWGCYWGSNGKGYLIEPFRDPEGLVCQTTGVIVTFLTMLLSLQVLLLIWFGMIVNVAWKVVTGAGAEDTRSDDEEELEEKAQTENLLPTKEVVCVEDLHLGARLSNSPKAFRKGPSAASGVSLGHDRKDLLGRIGCDKPPES